MSMITTGKALVLGGGGITGIAWETGLLAGLAESGVDLTTAGLVVGTSAGSIVGAQVTSGTPLDELYRRQLLTPAELGDGSAPLASIGLPVVARFVLSLVQARGDLARFGRVLSARAVRQSARGRTPTVLERYEQVAQRIGGITWPEQTRLLVTAVDVETGERRAFSRDDAPAVTLEDAVNASCAVPTVYPPITVAGRAYVDGGVWSGANADLAQGYGPVVALTPADRSVGPIRSAAQQLGALGVPHLVIAPDAASKLAIGKNVLDPAARPPSARAGWAQGVAWADRVRDVWG